jgi:hypothetical protein
VNVHRRDERDYTCSDAPLAVIVCRTNHGPHIGILYLENDNGDQAVLHLAFHCVLRLDRLKQETLWKTAVWAAPPVDAETAEAVAALCRLVYRTNAKDGLPYAFNYIEAEFDIGTGHMTLGPNTVGLTCATFVLALLNSYKIRLLRQSEWKPRKDDVYWQRSIVKWLKKSPKATPDHVKAVAAEVGCARFRPPEIVAAAGSTNIPVGFDDAIRKGNEVQAILNSLPSA